jgi:hypothetical protein
VDRPLIRHSELKDAAARHVRLAHNRPPRAVWNLRKRMAELVKHAGTCADLTDVDELQRQRRKG